MSHPRHELDQVVHSPVRFSIMAALSPLDRAEFRMLRDTVEVSDSALSQHLTTLEQADYIIVTKAQKGRRTTTWVSLTPTGREAFRHHLQTLNRIAQQPAAGDAE
ncbi:DNA-binding MarR family transcriptional regulator [Nocardiopsis mwathae]|uniref:DNA-binding MarR family transcriptional regulator n=1 Tax=Nocardiopsis mwathae TaxID=1472723 RepID=A0A7W9YMA6_9ACTN|nr:transcriptional regulator [Nocardiopsis mwathae]MBB6174778.1 DNA-binding MarR family transcriptional regulator [Nocardiopsis mwathae]